MLTPIEFNHDLPLDTREVYDIFSYRVLAAKTISADLLFS
jgi:hypothetical protein